VEASSAAVVYGLPGEGGGLVMAAAKRLAHRDRMLAHSAAIRELVESARDRVLAARHRYMSADAGDTRAMVEAQSLLLLALEQFFDASERASGRR